jgi:SpoVK/Ycf46/Vps4 family AAA+-type ATPase
MFNTEQLANTFELETTDRQLSEAAISAFHNQLTQKIRQLLLSDFNRLLQIAYRLDVAEADFVAAMAKVDPSAIACALADVFIARERKRIATRLAN